MGAEQSWFPLLSGTSPKSANNSLDQLLASTGRKHVLLIMLNPARHKTLHASKPKESDRCGCVLTFLLNQFKHHLVQTLMRTF